MSPLYARDPSAIAWYRRGWRTSPIGLAALGLAFICSVAYLTGRPLSQATEPLESIVRSDTKIAVVVAGSGVAILLSLISVAVEKAQLPAALSLFLLAIVEDLIFPDMPILTFMLGRWGLGTLYALLLTLAVLLAFIRLGYWLRHEVRRCPIGLTAFVLSVVSSAIYFRYDLLPLDQNNTSFVTLANTQIILLVAVVGSGIAILLSFISIATEKVLLPALLSLALLASIETLMLPMMPIWTFMLATRGLGLLYALSLLVAVLLIFTRIVRTIKRRL